MASKDINKQTTKTSLMDELKSIKGVLNTDDDNIPLLLDDEDIPVLASDDDIPVLTSPDEAIANKASLDAAIQQLESMQLSPKSSKAEPDKASSLEQKIRNNAAASSFEDKATTVRENPFMAKKPTDRFAESRKQAEDALKSVIAHSKAMSNPAKPAAEAREHTAAPKEAPPKKPIEFTADATADKSAIPKPQQVNAAVEEDASAAILKLLDEASDITSDLGLGGDFGELVEIDVDALIREKPVVPKTAAPSLPVGKIMDAQIDAIIDEVVEEYMIILEAALRKKLKEKLPDLLKK